MSSYLYKLCELWPWTMTRSSSYDKAIRYVLPVLWMTSYFHIMGNTWCMARLTAEEKENANRGSWGASAALPLCALPPSDWHHSTVSLAVRNGVWLWSGPMHCARGQSLLSLILICLPVCLPLSNVNVCKRGIATPIYILFIFYLYSTLCLKKRPTFDLL